MYIQYMCYPPALFIKEWEESSWSLSNEVQALCVVNKTDCLPLNPFSTVLHL